MKIRYFNKSGYNKNILEDIQDNKYDGWNRGQDFFRQWNSWYTMNLMNLCMYNIMDHIIDNYNYNCNNLQYNRMNIFRYWECNKDSY